MRIGIIGINHKSAVLWLREKLAIEAEQLFGPDHAAHFRFSYVLLSTCNRTEIYFHSDDPAQTHTYLLNAMRERIEEEFEHCIYSYFGIDCFFHLARVTAGVDSALIGETEIQGQVKRAYETAHDYRSLAPELHYLFQKCLKIGKDVRSKYQPIYGLPCLEHAVLNIATRILGNLNVKKILFVGLSEINHKIFLRLKRNGCCRIFFCNRTFEKVQSLADKEPVGLLPWQDLDRWPSFDVAIFGTKSPHFLVGKEQLTSNLTCRLVIDLSVPRNVDPKVGRHPAITLLNVDQLNRAIDRKRKLKALEMARLETHMIAQSVERQAALFQMKELQRSHFALSPAI
jgi:glutamyl-tRNA reductase